jgi:hypothetical protein
MEVTKSLKPGPSYVRWPVRFCGILGMELGRATVAVSETRLPTGATGAPAATISTTRFSCPTRIQQRG